MTRQVPLPALGAAGKAMVLKEPRVTGPSGRRSNLYKLLPMAHNQSHRPAFSLPGDPVGLATGLSHLPMNGTQGEHGP
jgi:hypothetical protein